MQPTPGDIHVNRYLSGVSVAHFSSVEDFITPKAGHTIPVENQTDMILRFKKGAFFRDEMKERAPGAESEGGGYELDSPLTYRCPVYAYHHDIPDQVRANNNTPVNNDRAATQLVTRKGLIRRERVFSANLLASTAGWDVKRAGVASGSYVLDTNVVKWNDYTNSNPITDVKYYATKVQLASGGFRPKRAITTRPVWDVLAEHPDFIGLISGGASTAAPSIVSRKLVAEKFELDDLLVMESVYDASVEGAAWSPSFIGGNTFLLYYSPPSPGIEIPSAFYGFAWKGMMGMSDMGTRIRKYRMEHLQSDRVEIDASFDWKLTGADMAALMYDLL